MVGSRFFRGLAEGWQRAPQRSLAALAAVVCLLAAAPAFADCQQVGSTVTCSGTDNDGFNAGAQNALTVNVLTGAAVNNLVLGGIAIQLNDNNVVTNNGAIAGGDGGAGIQAGSGNTITNAVTGTITVSDGPGIFVFDNNTVTNLGSILVPGCGCSGPGIMANNFNLITNAGSISGGDLGVGISVADNNAVINRGTISFGADSAGITAGANNTITNAAGGTITVGDAVTPTGGIFVLGDHNTITNAGAIHVGNSFGAGLAGILVASNNNTVLNSGSITGGDNTGGIVGAFGGGDNNTVTNTGTITLGKGTVGILMGVGNSVTNLGAITVGAPSSCGCFPSVGIQVDTNNTVVNGGTIVGGAQATGIVAFSHNTITNAGAITVGDNVTSGTGGGIIVFDHNTIVNVAGASITAGMFGAGIAAEDNNSITNNGLVTVGAGGSAIALGSTNNFINNGTVRAGAGGFSIQSCGACTSDNVVVNNGTVDGMVDLEGTNHSFTNNGLLTITDPSTPIGSTHIIQGSFVQNAAGTLALRLDNTGAHDALNATTATLGGTLRAVLQPGLYGSSTVYLGVVTSTNPITTTFAQVTSTLSSPFLTVTAIYHPNSVDLTLTRIPFGAAPGETQNQRNVGNYLEQNYSTALTGVAATFFSNLLASPSLAVLDRLSGEGTSGTQQTAFNAGEMFNNAMLNQALSFLDGPPPANDLGPQSTLLQYAATEKAPRPEYKAFSAIRPDGALRTQPWRAWMTGFGGNQLLRGDAVVGSADTSTRTIGGAGGFDYQVSPGLLLGFAGGASASDFAVPDRATSGKVDGSHVGGYGIYRWAQAYVAGTLSYSHFDNDTTRSIVGVGPAEIARGQFGSDQFGGRLQAGYKFAFDRFAVTPFAAVQYLDLWQHGYTEASVTATGAPGILGLTFQSRTISSLPTFLGAQFDTRIAFTPAVTAVPYLRASWVHEFKPDRSIAAALGFLPIGNFIVDGPRAARDAARIEAGGNLYIARNVALFASFIGEYSNSTHSNAGNGGLRVTW